MKVIFWQLQPSTLRAPDHLRSLVRHLNPLACRVTLDSPGTLPPQITCSSHQPTYMQSNPRNFYRVRYHQKISLQPDIRTLKTTATTINNYRVTILTSLRDPHYSMHGTLTTPCTGPSYMSRKSPMTLSPCMFYRSAICMIITEGQV